MTRFFGGTWWGRPGPVRGLGRLESAVMEIMWRGGREMAVREVQARLARPIAYTTVMTTLDRLFKKGFTHRRREGRAFVYSAALAKHELEATMTTGLLTDLLSASEVPTPVLSNLVDVVADRDDRLLDELERLVRDKRERLKRERG